MKTMKITFTGITPLLLHSDRGVNVLDPLVKQLKTFTSKRKKTDDDYLQVARLEYELALPVNQKKEPALPTYQIAACIRDGAKKFKQGKTTRSAIFINGDRGYVPIIYSGPKTVDELFADNRFVDARTVVISRARVIRTRPVFPDWSLKFTMDYDNSVFDEDQVKEFLSAAGQYCGIGDYRPEFGRFMIK